MIRKKTSLKNNVLSDIGNSKISTLLVTPLVILAFFTGYLWMRVTALEKKVGRNGGSAGQDVAGAPQQPEADLTAARKVDGDHIRGDKNAAVVLVEYSDYECPFCKRFHGVMQQVMKDYGNKVAWVYRHYPLAFHQNAMMESEAAECVAELGGEDKFWQYSDKLYEKTTSNGTSFNADQLAEMAGEVKVDKAKFKSCLDSGKHRQKIEAEIENATGAGIQGTPGTIIISKDGQRELIPGALPIEEVKPMIDRYL